MKGFLTGLLLGTLFAIVLYGAFLIGQGNVRANLEPAAVVGPACTQIRGQEQICK